MKMRKFYILFLLPFLATIDSFSQACSVHISATDTLVCTGDEITLTATAYGPGSTLMASNTAGNNHRGNMFDIVATNDITILSFDASPMGNTTIEIYYKVGTWNGFANTPSAWTFVGSAPVPYTGGFSAVPVNVNVTIPAGQTYAFYVTSNTSAVSLNYSNGTNVGNVYSADANLTFLEGGGMEYPFTQNTGAVYQPRVWNGNIHYALANVPGTTYLWGTGQTTTNIPDTLYSNTQYTVQSTVPGCPVTTNDTFDITLSIPVVSAGMDHSLCVGDSLVLYGSGALNYSWNNSITDSVYFTPSNSASYIVAGTDTAGCIDNDTVLVTVHQLPLVNAGADYSVCAGDTTTLSGQGAVTYVWNNSITDNVAFVPVSTLNYIVLGTDINGCENRDTINIILNTVPNVSAGPDQETCAGIEFTLNGSGAVSYVWNNGVTNGLPFIPSSTGTYIVTGTDVNGCTNSDAMSFIVNDITAVIVPVGGTLLTSSDMDLTFQWVNCSGYTPISGATLFGYTPNAGGNYAVIVTSTTTGCSDTSSCELIAIAGLEELPNEGLTVYPIPTNGNITVASETGIINTIELVDMVGKVLVTVHPNENQAQLDLSAYMNSTFFLRIYRDGKTTVMKVIKN